MTTTMMMTDAKIKKMMIIVIISYSVKKKFISFQENTYLVYNQNTYHTSTIQTHNYVTT